MFLKIITLLVFLTSVPQLYVIPGGTDIPLNFVISIFLFPTLLANFRFFITKKIFFVAILILLTQVVSLLWSIKISEGIRDISYMVCFWLLIAAVYQLHMKDPDFVYLLIKLLILFVTIEAFTIILFRLLPDLKLAIILSPPMRFILGQNALDSLIIEGARNNFYDPAKSGGILFVNANIAACYVGISSFLSYCIAKVKDDFGLKILSVFLWCSIFFTGSKASVIFCIAIPFIRVFSFLPSSKKIIYLVLFFIPILIAIFYTSSEVIHYNNDFLSSTAATTDSRLEIWTYGLKSFIDSPLIGQGYGGWAEGYKKIATDIIYPPHNTLLFMWSKSGILSAIFCLWFMIEVTRLSINCMRTISSVTLSTLGGALFMVCSWIFIHGLGENFGLIGEPHQMMILAIVIAICYSQLHKHKLQMANGN